VTRLAVELRHAIRRHWVTKDSTADWEQLVREEHQTANSATPDSASGVAPAAQPVGNSGSDATPLALRGRFKEHMSLQFSSEVLRQIQLRIEARDDRGRPLILPRDARLIADTARTVAALLNNRADSESSSESPFADSPTLRPLIAEGSQRVISRAVEKFDQRQPERFLPIEAVDELIQAECHALLDECLQSTHYAKAIAALVDLDQAIVRTVDGASTDLLQCGCDRRTLFFVPRQSPPDVTVDKLRSARPLAAAVPADVEDLVILSEAAGISPRSVALGLERVFPGIADAARRLLTRIDIEWQSLV
jgi:hypothetical protein